MAIQKGSTKINKGVITLNKRITIVKTFQVWVGKLIIRNFYFFNILTGKRAIKNTV